MEHKIQKQTKPKVVRTCHL